jgi:twitching motility protein PilJ
MNTMTNKVGILQQETEQISTRVKNLTNFVELASKFSKDQKRVAALTRVLALNASMIANRASQQQDPEQFMSIAKEFETIANQVNNLAVETNENLIELQQRTDQIETVVSGLNQDTKNINEVVRDFILGIQESYQMFGQISQITQQIVEVEKEVMKSSQNITDLSANTLNSIENISKIGQNTEAEMKITLEQTNVMGTLAQNLLEITKFFRTN